MKSLRLRRIFPPWHGWGLEEPTVLHLDTICSRGRAPPPLLASEGVLFGKYLVFKYLKATLVILYNLKILLIPLFIRFNVKLVFRKRKRGITTGRYFHQKGIFVTNLHFPHIQTPDPGHSSDIKICQQIFCEGNIILYTNTKYMRKIWHISSNFRGKYVRKLWESGWEQNFSSFQFRQVWKIIYYFYTFVYAIVFQ